MDDPTVSVGRTGDVAVAWVDQARRDVLFQSFSEEGRARLAEPVNVSRSPRLFSWLPRIVLAGMSSDRIYLLWQEIVFSGGSHGGETFFARSVDGGKTFEAPLNLSNSVPGDGKGRINAEVWHNGSHDLVEDPTTGALYATWTEYDGPLWFARSADGGASFSCPRQIAGSHTEPARAPALAAGADGRVYLAWTVGEDKSADVRVAASDDGGETFGAPAIVARTGGYSDAPKLTVGRQRELHLLYAESPEGPFADAHVLYTRSFDHGATFEAPRELSSPLPSGYRGAAFPSFATDGAENMLVAWELYPNRSDDGPRGLGYTVSRNGGRSFNRPALVPGSVDPPGINGSLQGRLMKKAAMNLQGAVAIANSSFREGESSRVWIMRGRLPLPGRQGR